MTRSSKLKYLLAIDFSQLYKLNIKKENLIIGRLFLIYLL